MWNDGIEREGKRKHNGGSRKKLLHIAGFQRHISLEKNDAKREEISLSMGEERMRKQKQSDSDYSYHHRAHKPHKPLNDYAVQLRATFQYKIKTQLHIYCIVMDALLYDFKSLTRCVKSLMNVGEIGEEKMKAKRAEKSPLKLGRASSLF